MRLRFLRTGLRDAAGDVLPLVAVARDGSGTSRLRGGARSAAPQFAEAPDELRVVVNDPKTARQALQAAERVLKGWQEDADPGSERRGWRWMLEGDCDAHGYDHNGESVGLWGFLRLSLERGGVGEAEKGEDVDLDGFGFLVEADKAG